MNTPAPAPVSRSRRIVRHGGRGLAVLAVLGLALLAWLLSSTAGRDTLLARIVAQLPPGALTWERAEGVVRGPLVLHGVRYRADGVVFTAERMLLDPDLLPVLGRRLQLDRLEVDGAVLVMPPAADEPFELPRWPDDLPRLALPLDLRAATLRVRGFELRRGESPPLRIASADGRGIRFVDDGLAVDDLVAAGPFGRATLRGGYRPARRHATDLLATWERPATADAAAVSLELSVKGDAGRAEATLAGATPAPFEATLILGASAAAPGDDTATPGHDAPPGGTGTPWSASLRADGVDPTLLGADPGEPWRATLQAVGRGGVARLHGDATVDGLAIGIEPSTLALTEAVLSVRPLRLVLPAGAVEIRGEISEAAGRAAFDLHVDAPDLAWQPSQAQAGAAPVRAAVAADVRGSSDAWTLDANARLARAGARVRVDLAGTGDDESLAIGSLAVFREADGNGPSAATGAAPSGAPTLTGTGRVSWSPSLAFELDARLDGFDPGHFAADYPGAVDAAMVVRGERDADGRWRGALRLDDLAGRLRDRALGGHVHVDAEGGDPRVDADVAVGASRATVLGTFGDVLDLRATFAPLRLEDLLAGGAGRLDGTLALHGPRTAVDVDADLAGHDLRRGDDRVDTLRVLGRLPARGDGGALRVDATGAVVAGVALDRLGIDVRGSVAAARVDAEATGPAGAGRLAGEVARDGDTWRGTVGTLFLAPADGPRLALAAPFGFRVADGVPTFARACVVAIEAGGRLCALADGRLVTVEAEAVPLALVQPWLPVDEAVPMQAFGLVDADLRLRRERGAWVGGGTLRSARGGLRLVDDLDHEVFVYDDLALVLELGAASLDARFDASLAGGGSVEATLRGGRAATAPVDGTLTLDVRDLTWLELFSEDLAAPVGRLTGTLALAGSRAAPRLSGRADLTGFGAELPGLGVKLVDGDVDLVGRDDGVVSVVGRVRSGDGVLALDGSLDIRDAQAPVRLGLKGTDVTLASTPELYVVADPDLVLRWLPEALEVRGSLRVDDARVDLEALDTSADVSPDVVVIDAPADAGTRAKPLDLELSVTLGDDVRLDGFGLDGTMAGTIVLTQRPGRPATGAGTLEVGGSYRAYGQSLEIERGRLSFAPGTPFDDPVLDIRADRAFDSVRVGVRVRGTARRPETTIVSNPAMDTSEALSWLVLGRPLETTTSGESRQIGAAALALGAGGNLVAQQIGAKLGLDEAGIVDSRNLGGATFTVGKYVSPRLFLSYGVSLVGTGQVVTLKYLLSRGFDITIESGQENAASVNWRTER